MTDSHGPTPQTGPQDSPAAERNKGPILDVLRRVLPPRGLVLEIASGTGQHIAHFARALPELSWQPTDPDANMRAALRARLAAEKLGNVAPPVALDARHDRWPIGAADAVLCSNMIHIAPWTAAQGLVRGASRALAAGAPLVLYGPFKRAQRHTAPSNEAFDANLQARNPEWGVRNLETVTELARAAGFALGEVVAMPANNLTVVLVRTADETSVRPV